MSLLTANASGANANTNGNAPAYINKDPLYVANNLINTVYCWATVWDTAQIQIYVSPQRFGTSYPTVWFPVEVPVGGSQGNVLFTFQHRWAQIKAEIINASSMTQGVFCDLFTGGQ